MAPSPTNSADAALRGAGSRAEPRRRRRRRLLVVLGLALVAGALVGLDHWLPYMLLSHYKFSVDPDPEVFTDYGATHKAVTFRTNDGLKIAGCWVNRALRKAERIGSFSVRETSPVRNIASVTCPMLIIHGDADAYVPFADGQTLYDVARDPKEFYAIPGADHGTMFARGGDELTERIAAFVLRACPAN